MFSFSDQDCDIRAPVVMEEKKMRVLREDVGTTTYIMGSSALM